MKTILLPMVGYVIHPQYGINFLFSNNCICHIDTITNLNAYPYTSNAPVNTGSSGGIK